MRIRSICRQAGEPDDENIFESANITSGIWLRGTIERISVGCKVLLMYPDGTQVFYENAEDPSELDVIAGLKEICTSLES